MRRSPEPAGQEPELLAITDIAKLVKAKISIYSIRRWMIDGVGTPRIKLRHIRIGAKFFTRREWWDEFLRACEDPSSFATHRCAARTEKAKKRLIKAGV